MEPAGSGTSPPCRGHGTHIRRSSPGPVLARVPVRSARRTPLGHDDAIVTGFLQNTCGSSRGPVGHCHQYTDLPCVPSENPAAVRVFHSRSESRSAISSPTRSGPSARIIDARDGHDRNDGNDGNADNDGHGGGHGISTNRHTRSPGRQQPSCLPFGRPCRLPGRGKGTGRCLHAS